VGAPESEELFGGDEFDAETAAAIEASAREAKEREAFLAEAGMAGTKPNAALAASAAGPAAAAYSRSETDQQATMAALEELRLEKQRAAAGAGASVTSTPQKGPGFTRSPSINSLPNSGASSLTNSPAVTKIDRPNLPVPTRPIATRPGAAAAAGTLTIPGPSEGSNSNPGTPRSLSLNASPAPSISPALSPSAAAAAAAARAGPVELPDLAPSVPSAKRTREVNAVIEADAERASETGVPKEKLNMVVIGHVDSYVCVPQESGCLRAAPRADVLMPCAA